MKVVYSDSELEVRFRHPVRGVRAWGSVVAQKYVMRIITLKRAKTIQDLFGLRALRLHPLQGTKLGRHAIALHGRWRLEVTLGADIIRIEEVSNHYGD